jgi:hypothetical protein
MRSLRHKGVLDKGGQRIVLVFNKLPEDPENCLVIEYDRLTDAYRQNLMTILESENGQKVPEFYMALEGISFGDGQPILNALHNMGLMRKVPVKEVVLTPNNQTRLPLEVLLQVLDEDAPPELINEAIITAETIGKHDEIKLEQSNEEIALGLLATAKSLELDASKKKEQAYVLCPSMRPQAGRPKLAKTDKEKRRVERNRMRRERYAEMVAAKS